MGKVAFVFSGQGAQHVGMGRELYENCPAAKAVFDVAESVRPGTIEQCFSGSEQELTRTENTQPCIYCVDLAAAAALKEAGVMPDMLAGFSIGELAALAFSEAISYEDGFRLVCKRGELMQSASDKVAAGMSAVLKLQDNAVQVLCAEFENVHPVNFNCDGQVVVAGVSEELALFMARVKASGGRAMQLKVGGGFHSPLMAKASEDFLEALVSFDIGYPQLPLYSNVTALPYENDTKELLAKQVCSPVMWKATILNMINSGADTFIEVGPGKTLTGLISRISSDVRVFNVEDNASVQHTAHNV